VTIPAVPTIANRRAWVPAAVAVPWLLWAAKTPSLPDSRLAIWTRHWGILRQLGLPRPPYTKLPSWAVDQGIVLEEMEEG